MADESKPNSRVLWVSLLYNWDTRKKVIALLDDETLFDQPREPGDYLYRAEFNLYPPGDDGSTTMEFESVREEWETRKPKGEETTEAYIARRAFYFLSGMAPPFSFGPGNPIQASNCPGQNFVEFTLSGEKYRITVERVK